MMGKGNDGPGQAYKKDNALQKKAPAEEHDFPLGSYLNRLYRIKKLKSGK